MKKKVGIGIIGTGFAKKVQIPSFLECENAEIVSVASGHLENAKETANEFNIKHFTDDWRETVENRDADLICITTPPATHHEITLAAIAGGKHILCEKPMAMNATQAREITEKAADKKILALIDHELRFLNGRQKAFKMLRNGEIGKIRHTKCSFRNSSRGAGEMKWNWWSDKNSGGGALGAIGSHTIDSLNWFLGTEISQVFCQLQTHVKNRKDEKTGEMREVTTDDEANLIVRFADGDLLKDATGTIAISMVEHGAYQNRMEFFGTNGTIRIDSRGELFIAKAGDKDWKPIEVKLGKSPKGVFDSGFPSGFMAFAPKIVDAIRNGETEIEHAATFEDGLKVQKVIDAAHESNEKNCAVKV